MGPASDVADAVLGARGIRKGDAPTIVVTSGIDGQVTALVLAAAT